MLSKIYVYQHWLTWTKLMTDMELTETIYSITVNLRSTIFVVMENEISLQFILFKYYALNFCRLFQYTTSVSYVVAYITTQWQAHLLQRVLKLPFIIYYFRNFIAYFSISLSKKRAHASKLHLYSFLFWIIWSLQYTDVKHAAETSVLIHIYK